MELHTSHIVCSSFGEVNPQVSAHSFFVYTQTRSLGNNLGQSNKLNYHVPLEQKENVNIQSHLIPPSSVYQEKEKQFYDSHILASTFSFKSSILLLL